MFKLKEEKQSLGGVIADSFSLLAHTWAINIVVVLIALVVSGILLLIFGAGPIHSLMKTIAAAKAAQGPGPYTPNLAAIAPSFGAVILFLIGIFLISWFLKIINAVIVRSCWNVATTGHAHLGNAFAVGFKYFYVYLLQLLVMIGITVVMYIIQYAVSLLNMHWLTAIVAIITQLIVYYITVKLILVDTAAVVDECGLQGFSRSWNFIAGSWWRTLGSIVFSTLFYVIFLYVIGIGIVTLIFMPAANSLSMHVVNTANVAATHPTAVWFGIIFAVCAIATLLALIFTVPTMLSGNQALIYNDLKHRQ